MLVILIRHGNALNHDIDALRPLSDQGKAEAKETGLFLQDFLKDQSHGNVKIFHSELLRAKETALIVSGQLNQSPTLEEGSDLLPNSSTGPWHNNLHAFEENETVILVGHMPFMGIFASEMLKKSTSLPTGGCLVFEREEESQNFKLLVTNY